MIHLNPFCVLNVGKALFRNQHVTVRLPVTASKKRTVAGKPFMHRMANVVRGWAVAR